MRHLTTALGMVLLAGSLAATGCDTRRSPTIAGLGTPVFDTASGPNPPAPQQPILLAPPQSNMLLGDTLRLVASGGIAGVALSWATNNTGIVVIQSTSGATALIRAVGTGFTSVSVTAVGDPSRSAAATINVMP